MKQINATPDKASKLNIQLNHLEQQYDRGLLQELSYQQREQIESQLRDMYDIDDLDLLFGTELGYRYLLFRERLLNQAMCQSITAA